MVGYEKRALCCHILVQWMIVTQGNPTVLLANAFHTKKDVDLCI